MFKGFSKKWKGPAILSAVLLAPLVMMSSCLSGPGTGDGPDSVELAILTTTDMHGRIYNINPLNGRSVNNTYLKTATVIKEQRAQYGANTLLIDAGDIIQGSAMTSFNVNSEGGDWNPMAISLRYIGYDAFVPGNHEYNYTVDIQQKFYNMLRMNTTQLAAVPESARMKNAMPPGIDAVLNSSPAVPAVAANILNPDGTPKSNFVPYVVKTFKVGRKTFKVGILGFENVNVPNWDPRSHYPDTLFSHSDNTAQTYAYEWTQYWSKQLKNVEKCDIVIAAAHSGFGVSEVNNSNKENQMRHLIENTTGIDLVIGGHDHTPRTELVKNKDGKDVPYLNAGCNNVTKNIVTLNKDGTYAVALESEQIALNADVADDEGLKALMETYYTKADAFVQVPIATLSAEDGAWDKVNNFFITQGDAYDLVSEAQLWAAGGADVSITADVHRNNWIPSVLFEGSAKTASISLKNIYDLYQFDNNLLYGIKLSGPELLAWMEETAKYYTVNGNAVEGSGYGLDHVYGVSYEVYAGNPVGQRIKNAVYKGRPLAEHTAPDIKVALNSYRLSASAENDSYGWFKATGVNTDSKDRVYFVAAETPEFGPVGGSATLIIGEYLKARTAKGESVKPPRLDKNVSGNYTKWTVSPSKAP
ncbi:bifunctional metallophosphatase/5'-nucleotidase [Treponema primitia]|nr:metallophosphoesterase [Treponema primitia]